jgi:hypothetical protein
LLFHEWYKLPRSFVPYDKRKRRTRGTYDCPTLTRRNSAVIRFERRHCASLWKWLLRQSRRSSGPRSVHSVPTFQTTPIARVPQQQKWATSPPYLARACSPFLLFALKVFAMTLTEDNVAVTSRRSLRRSQVRWTSSPLMCTSKRTWRAWFRAASPQTFNLLQAQIQRVWSLDTGYVAPCKAAKSPPQHFVLF